MKMNKLTIKTEICAEQIRVSREIKALKREIKYFAKKLADLDTQMSNYLRITLKPDEIHRGLLDDWDECYYAQEKAKETLKALKNTLQKIN